MLRLSPPGFERFFQSPVLGATFGGGEANGGETLACLTTAAAPSEDGGDSGVGVSGILTDLHRTLSVLGTDPDGLMARLSSHPLIGRMPTELRGPEGIAPNDPRVFFSQLYGMSDNISFNLAKAGYNVAKYLPYGPVRAVLPYLIRRAQENSAIASQGGREVRLIRGELQRRKQARALPASGQAS